jgi:hypothetical protein
VVIDLKAERLSMSTSRIGKEAQSVPPDVNEILANHSEALVITADPDGGESKIAVFTKLLDNKGVIAPLLADLLNNLLSSVKHNGQCSTFQG